MSQPDKQSRRGLNWQPWNLLLLVSLFGTLIPPIYNRREPELFDIPFFYWYQMLWIPIAVVTIVIVYRQTKGTR